MFFSIKQLSKKQRLFGLLFVLFIFTLPLSAKVGKPRLTKAEARQRLILQDLRRSKDLADFNAAIEHATQIGQYAVADSLVDRSRPLLNRSEDSLVYYEHLRLKARLYTILNRYPKALELFSKSLQYYQDNKLWEQEGRVIANVIEFYRSSGMYNEARSEVRYLTQHPDFEKLSSKVKAIAFHRFAAVINEGSRNLDSTILISNKSLSYSEPDSILDEMGTSFLELGYAYSHKKESRAIYYFEQAYRVFEEQGRIHYMCNAVLHIASYFMRVRSDEQALEYLDSAISMASPYELPGFLNVAYEKKAKVLARMGQYQEAFALRDTAALLYETDVQVRFTDNLAIQSRRFQTQISESRQRALESERLQVAEESRRNSLIQQVFIASLIVLLFILAGLYFFFTRIKRSKEHLEESERALFGANQELLNTLEEKDGLIEEVHHRVKNNLQLITSLIRVQQFQQKDNMSPQSQQMVDDILSRVTAMAVVHEKLYAQQHISQLRAKEYFTELLSELQTIGGQLNHPLVINIEARDEQLEVSHGIALGMICAELVSNSLKYAFKDVDKPQIDVGIQKRTEAGIDKVLFTYRDNGKGFKQDSKMGMGNRLISLFSRQLEGKYTLKSDNQFYFSLEYKEE